MSYILPFYTFGKNAEAVGENCCLYALFMFIPILNLVMAAKLRGKIREAQGIDGSTGGDCATWIFCGFCALVQEAGEVKAMQSSGMATDIERE